MSPTQKIDILISGDLLFNESQITHPSFPLQCRVGPHRHGRRVVTDRATSRDLTRSRLVARASDARLKRNTARVTVCTNCRMRRLVLVNEEGFN